MEYGSYDNTSYPPPPPANGRRPEYVHRNSSTGRSQNGEIEQVVTKLLRTTKALLEALTHWSQLRATTADILDFRETLERQFHSVSQAFEDNGVPMNDLAWIPHQLKDSISVAMNEEPSPTTLEQHLPKIRDVIVHLLHGLKGKQHQLRERETAAWSRDSMRSTDSWRREVPQAALARGANLAQSPTRPYYPADRSPPPSAARITPSDYDPRTSGMPRPSVSSDSSSTSRMNYPPPQNRPYSPTYLPSSPRQQQPRIPSPSRSTSSSVAGDDRMGTGLGRPNSTSSSSRGYFDTRPASPIAHPPPPPPPPPPPMSSPAAVPARTSPSDFDENDPGTASALAALKRQENLARRSSVRRASMLRGNNDYHPMKRPANEYVPPVPSLPTPDTRKLGTVDEMQNDNAVTTTTAPQATKDEGEKGLSLYLQIGNNTKKVQYTGEVSLSALRMLFIEKFNYSSGLNDFPSIYIRDPAINVSYELENLQEVTNKSVLSLNVDEDVAQKQWLQQVTDSVEKEMGEIRKLFIEHVDEIKKQVAQVADNQQAAVPPPPPPPPPPAPAQAPEPESSSTTADVPEPTTTTSSSNEENTTISTQQLQSQLKEIETLRRDMAVLRQLQREMRESTDGVVQELKDKAEELRKQDEESKDKQTARAAARLFIEEGKEKVLADSDKITARLEDLQDTVDQLKLDVTQRKCRPSDAQMAHCNKERDMVSKEIEEFGEYLVSVKPRWKKTWEMELQTIVKEQQMLKEQEGLLLDMRDDLAALVEVYDQLEKICAYQKKAKPVMREFHVAPAEEGFEGMSSVLKQVQTIDVDHDRRLKALNQAEKMRQRELDNRIDEFEQELSTFVDSKKLKKTGGAEEIERQRKQKDQEMLRRMYMEQRENKQPQPNDDDDDNENSQQQEPEEDQQQQSKENEEEPADEDQQ